MGNFGALLITILRRWYVLTSNGDGKVEAFSLPGLHRKFGQNCDQAALVVYF